AAEPARAGPAGGAELSRRRLRRRAWLLLVPWTLLAPSEAQITITTPADPNTRDKPLQRTYGRPEPVDLDQIAYNGASYQKRNVITRGVLDGLVEGRYLSLRQGAAEVMIVPMDGNAYVHMKDLLGRDVDVTGVVRVLPGKQATHPNCG